MSPSPTDEIAADRPLQVLLVDDNVAYHDVIRDLLDDAPGITCELTCVSTYDQGLQALLDGACDVCLLDYILDKKDGLQLLAEAHAADLPTAVIMLTGQGTLKVDTEAIRSGASDYIEKLDINSSSLVRAIRHAIERKKSESELRGWVSVLHATLDSITEGILVLDSDSRVTTYNQRLLELWGMPEELLDGRDGRNVLAFFVDAAEDSEQLQRQIEAMWSAGDAPMFERIRLKSGRVLEAWCRTHRVVGNALGKVCSFRDVTKSYREEAGLREARDDLERRVHERTADLSHALSALNAEIVERANAEEALQESEELLLHLTEYVPGVSIQGYRTDGTVVFWNRASEEIYGYRADEAVGRNLLDLLVPDGQRPRFEQRLQIGARIDESGEYAPTEEYVLRRKDGTAVPVRSIHTAVRLENGEAFLFSISVDLSERERAASAALRLAEAVEQAGEAVFITGIDGALHYVNPAFERITGYARDEVIGEPPWFLKSDQHDQQFYQAVIDTVLGGDVWQGRVVNLRKDRSPFEVDITISPVKNASGDAVNYVVVMRDVTKEVQLEQQLTQALKLESVGRLAGGVAHDFNNLLSPILAYSELALIQMGPDGRGRQELEHIRSAAERASDVTRQLLAFGRKQVLDIKVLNLNDVVSGFLKMLKRVTREDVEMAAELGDSVGCVEADRSQVEQILMNLAVNAQDAMPEGGRLIIRTGNAELGEEVADAGIGCEPGAYVMLSVEDTGEGMDDATVERIFDPFFTTKEPGQGTGLGLATVYGIVRQHHGHIQVRSEVGSGATFEVYLPLADSEPAENGPDTEIAAGECGTETVLVVEDEDMVLRLAQDILEEHGYHVLCASSSEEALALVQEHDEEIHLLLTDVILPRVNGKQLYLKLRRRRPGVKVLFMSGYTDNVIAQHGVMDSGINFLQKPFSVAAITHKVRQALDQETAKADSADPAE